MTARGIRNNNPGNIKHSDSVHWYGEVARGSLAGYDHEVDSIFCVFLSMEYGVRALALLLRNYQRKHDLRTITSIITRWAPGSENDTGAYIRAVALSTGYHSAALLNLNDRATLWRLVAAIIKHENGPDSKLVDAATISRGVSLALRA